MAALSFGGPILKIKNPNYWITSRNSNTVYWGEGASPDWTVINSFMWHPAGGSGLGVEPHYHDADEVWIFASGNGEASVGGKTYDVTPNTVVYTPMGTVHRFQMLTEFDNVSVVTRLERQKRPIHILEEVDGPPVPTVPGFVIQGTDNNGPIADRGPRCPFTELRHVDYDPGTGVRESTLPVNEHWLVDNGSVILTIDGFETELVQGDVAMLRAGATRQLSAPDGAKVCLVRE